MQYLAGFLLLVLVLTIPKLRRFAVWLITLGAIAIIAVLIFNRPKPAPPPPRAVSQAGDETRAADEARARALIPADQIELRDVWLEDGLGRITAPHGDSMTPSLHAVVHNGSTHTLTGVELAIDLLDCPPSGGACDRIGTIESEVRADIPPGDVRQMDSAAPYQRVDHIPPLHGTFTLKPRIVWTRGRD